MFKRSQVCSAMVVAFGGVLALSAAPSFGQTQLERVVITGSSIKRVDSETALPVTVMVPAVSGRPVTLPVIDAPVLYSMKSSLPKVMILPPR